MLASETSAAGTMCRQMHGGVHGRLCHALFRCWGGGWLPITLTGCWVKVLFSALKGSEGR